MHAKQSDATGDLVIRRSLTEKIIVTLVLLATTGSLGTNAYTSTQMSAGDAHRDTRISLVEEQNRVDARINAMVIKMGPLLERIDERTIQLQKSIDRLERSE